MLLFFHKGTKHPYSGKINKGRYISVRRNVEIFCVAHTFSGEFLHKLHTFSGEFLCKLHTFSGEFSLQR